MRKQSVPNQTEGKKEQAFVRGRCEKDQEANDGKFSHKVHSEFLAELSNHGYYSCSHNVSNSNGLTALLSSRPDIPVSFFKVTISAIRKLRIDARTGSI